MANDTGNTCIFTSVANFFTTEITKVQKDITDMIEDFKDLGDASLYANLAGDVGNVLEDAGGEMLSSLVNNLSQQIERAILTSLMQTSLFRKAGQLADQATNITRAVEIVWALLENYKSILPYYMLDQLVKNALNTALCRQKRLAELQKIVLDLTALVDTFLPTDEEKNEFLVSLKQLYLYIVRADEAGKIASDAAMDLERRPDQVSKASANVDGALGILLPKADDYYDSEKEYLLDFAEKENLTLTPELQLYKEQRDAATTAKDIAKDPDKFLMQSLKKTAYLENYKTTINAFTKAKRRYDIDLVKPGTMKYENNAPVQYMNLYLKTPVKVDKFQQKTGDDFSLYGFSQPLLNQKRVEIFDLIRFPKADGEDTATYVEAMVIKISLTRQETGGSVPLKSERSGGAYAEFSISPMAKMWDVAKQIGGLLASLEKKIFEVEIITARLHHYLSNFYAMESSIKNPELLEKFFNQSMSFTEKFSITEGYNAVHRARKMFENALLKEVVRGEGVNAQTIATNPELLDSAIDPMRVSYMHVWNKFPVMGWLLMAQQLYSFNNRTSTFELFQNEIAGYIAAYEMAKQRLSELTGTVSGVFMFPLNEIVIRSPYTKKVAIGVSQEAYEGMKTIKKIEVGGTLSFEGTSLDEFVNDTDSFVITEIKEVGGGAVITLVYTEPTDPTKTTADLGRIYSSQRFIILAKTTLPKRGMVVVTGNPLSNFRGFTDITSIIEDVRKIPAYILGSLGTASRRPFEVLKATLVSREDSKINVALGMNYGIVAAFEEFLATPLPFKSSFEELGGIMKLINKWKLDSIGNALATGDLNGLAASLGGGGAGSLALMVLYEAYNCVVSQLETRKDDLSKDEKTFFEKLRDSLAEKISDAIESLGEAGDTTEMSDEQRQKLEAEQKELKESMDRLKKIGEKFSDAAGGLVGLAAQGYAAYQAINALTQMDGDDLVDGLTNLFTCNIDDRFRKEAEARYNKAKNTKVKTRNEELKERYRAQIGA